VRDPQFGAGRDPTNFTLPEIELGPHVASLGMRFYTGTAFPAEYRVGPAR
jgi:glucose/arabinose dehydrogenase